MRNKNRFLSVLLSLAMVLSLLPTMAFATDPDPIDEPEELSVGILGYGDFAAQGYADYDILDSGVTGATLWGKTAANEAPTVTWNTTTGEYDVTGLAKWKGGWTEFSSNEMQDGWYLPLVLTATGTPNEATLAKIDGYAYGSVKSAKLSWDDEDDSALLVMRLNDVLQNEEYEPNGLTNKPGKGKFVVAIDWDNTDQTPAVEYVFNVSGVERELPLYDAVVWGTSTSVWPYVDITANDTKPTLSFAAKLLLRDEHGDPIDAKVTPTDEDQAAVDAAVTLTAGDVKWWSITKAAAIALGAAQDANASTDDAKLTAFWTYVDDTPFSTLKDSLTEFTGSSFAADTIYFISFDVTAAAGSAYGPFTGVSFPENMTGVRGAMLASEAYDLPEYGFPIDRVSATKVTAWTALGEIGNQYNVAVTAPANGTLSATVQRGEEPQAVDATEQLVYGASKTGQGDTDPYDGEDVTLNLKSAKGYELSSLTVTPAKNGVDALTWSKDVQTEQDFTISATPGVDGITYTGATFKMPASDVTVSATFAPISAAATAFGADSIEFIASADNAGQGVVRNTYTTSNVPAEAADKGLVVPASSVDTGAEATQYYVVTAKNGTVKATVYMMYSSYTTSGTTYTAYPVTGLADGDTITFYNRDPSGAKTDSAGVSVTVGQQEAPTITLKTAPANATETTAVVYTIPTGAKYKYNAASDGNVVDYASAATVATDIEVRQGSTVYAYVPATGEDNKLMSEVTTLTAPTYVVQPAETPVVDYTAIGAGKIRVTGVKSGQQYIVVNGGVDGSPVDITPTGSGTSAYVDVAVAADNYVKVYTKAVEGVSSQSSAVTLGPIEQAAAPTLESTYAIPYNATDTTAGVVSDLSTTMETTSGDSGNDASSWTAVPSNLSLAKGQYSVRVKANGKVLASANDVITVLMKLQTPQSLSGITFTGTSDTQGTLAGGGSDSTKGWYLIDANGNSTAPAAIDNNSKTITVSPGDLYIYAIPSAEQSTNKYTNSDGAKLATITQASQPTGLSIASGKISPAPANATTYEYSAATGSPSYSAYDPASTTLAAGASYLVRAKGGTNKLASEPVQLVSADASKYTITFDVSAGLPGTEIPAIFVEKNAATASDVNSAYSSAGIASTMSSAISAAGYSAYEWHVGSADGELFTFGSSTVTADTKLVAKFTAQSYTITLNANSGTAFGSYTKNGTSAAYASSISYTLEDTVTLPTTGTRAGYTFAGWYQTSDNNSVSSALAITSENATTDVTIPTGLHGNLGFTAKWTQDQIAGTLAAKLTNAQGATVAAGSVKSGTTLYADFSGVTLSGVKYAGTPTYSWKANGATLGTNQTQAIAAEKIGQNLTLTITAGSNGSLTLDLGVIQKGDAPALYVGTTRVGASPSGALKILQAEGGDIYGSEMPSSWQYRLKGTTDWTTVGATTYSVENLASGTYEVCWMENDKYTQGAIVEAFVAPAQVAVTFNPDGGTISGESAGASKNVNTGIDGTVELPTVAKAGFAFLGWLRADGTKVSGSTVFSEAETVTASWSAPAATTTTTGGSTGTTSGGSTGGGTSTGTETTTNADGSTTTTTTAANGTVTETTTAADGSKTETVTRTDGSSTKTETTASGTKVKTETAADGSATVEGKDANGTTASAKTDTDGKLTEAKANVTAATVTAAVEAAAADETPVVTLPVEVPAAGNAETAASIVIDMPASVSAENPVKVEIPVEDVKTTTVVVIVKEDGTEEVVKDCTVTKDGVVLGVEGNVTVKVIDNTKTFSDEIPDWAADEVNFVTSREIFNGNGDGTFNANQATSRGMVAQVLFNFDKESGNSTESGSFGDAAGKWYDEAASWANAMGVVQGSFGQFNGDNAVSRQDLATMLYRYANARGFDTAVTGAASSFSDAASVAGYAASAMQWCVEKGIINGIDGALKPTGSATRGQVAAMMARFVKNVAN